MKICAKIVAPPYQQLDLGKLRKAIRHLEQGYIGLREASKYSGILA
jgi:hypothetical protein